ncbi:ATP-binding protein [Pseudomonas sp. UMAB-40]|uniref:ATP-binding protein n=1 Tax=Pseudomonas sp. UMAB-40 TaxID=1365407 RepID=UPI00214BACEB|nr:ATP-binding protein [Pseudomonas sp. UMAB-40]
MPLRNYLLAVFVLGQLGSISPAHAGAQTLKLSGRSSDEGFILDSHKSDSNWLRSKSPLQPDVSALGLSVAEQRWLAKHPRVKVAVNDSLVPVSFFDQRGVYRGISADVLSKISQRTGLKFDVVRGHSMGELIRQIKQGDADLIAAFNASGEKDAELRVTRAYLTDPNVLINRDETGSPQAREAMASTFGLLAVQVGFATDRKAVELHSILDKALQSIPPQTVDALTGRWHDDVIAVNGIWLHSRSVVVPGFIFFGLLLLAAVGWIIYLRQLIVTREKAELALNDQMEFMRAMIDGTPHPIYVRDREGRLVSCNSVYLDVVGSSLEKVIGKKITDSPQLFYADTAAIHEEYLRVMDEGSRAIQDRVLRRRTGAVHTVYHWILPYRSSDGVVKGMIGGWIDISERQRLFDELQNAKKGADDANRAKTTFLATMSHEIRTPMNAVIGMLELAMKKADKGIMDRFAIEVASGAARGLLDLIGDILDIARIESGRLFLSPERAGLRELVESVTRMFEGVARQKGLRLLLDFDPQASRDVLIDPLRFKQILSNLLSNAIKFTDEGSVRLSVQAAPGNCDERLLIHVQVQDSGIGICAQDQEQLFSPFTQARNNHQSARGGSGLGLSISRTLCEMMKGQLHLSSAPGEGTQIDISLDLLVLQPLPAAAVLVTELEAQQWALNILVIDDYPANRLLLSQQLTYLGHGVSDAEDGAHGLRAWRNGSFDVVITDCNMPVMNGYELTRAIRDLEKSSGAKPCLILGFTANAQPEEKERCLAEGMDDCLFKPISLADLSARLASVQPCTEPLPRGGNVFETGSTIDLSSLQQLTCGDPCAIDHLLSDLAVSNEEDMLRLIRLFGEHDLPGLSDLAHRVKGGARIIKAYGLIMCCEQLEAVCMGGEWASLTEAVDALQQAMEQLAQTLELHMSADVQQLSVVAG